MTHQHDEQEAKPRKRRPRAPRIKPLPESMRDPRHNPEAAEAAIHAVLKAGGRPLTVDEAREWLGRVDLKVFEVIFDPQTGEARKPEKVERDKDGRPRFRSPHEKHGPGRLKMRGEIAIEQAEAEWARAVNAGTQLGTLLDHHKRAIQRAADLRSLKGQEVADKVCTLYDSSRLPPRNRAAAIAIQMTKTGDPISSRHVRTILRKYRPQ